MKITITSLDDAPTDLYEQVPIAARLIRQVTGDDRPDYWLGELVKPISWAKEDGRRKISHIVVVARWVGTKIEPGAELPVGIAYVTDGTPVNDQRFDLKKAAYVAIGMATVRENAE